MFFNSLNSIRVKVAFKAIMLSRKELYFFKNYNYFKFKTL